MTLTHIMHAQLASPQIGMIVTVKIVDHARYFGVCSLNTAFKLIFLLLFFDLLFK